MVKCWVVDEVGFCFGLGDLGIKYLADVMKFVFFRYTKELSRFQHCSIVMGWLPDDCLSIPV